jgi:hypothetical protein
MNFKKLDKIKNMCKNKLDRIKKCMYNKKENLTILKFVGIIKITYAFLSDFNNAGKEVKK